MNDIPFCNSHQCHFLKIGEFTDKDTEVIISIFRSPCCGSYMIRPLSVKIGVEQQGIGLLSPKGKSQNFTEVSKNE